MKIIAAKTAGFCFGVKRAVDMAFKTAKKKQKGIFTLGPIIHNPQVIEKLKQEGILPIEDITTPGIKDIIIRTHGIPLHIMNRISDAGFNIIDATCPFVKKAQHYAKLLREEGYQVIILGDREHPEVQGLMSYAGDDAIVVDSEDALPKIKHNVGIVVQTTQPVEALKKLFARVIEQAKNVKVYNTICSSTALRLKETAAMAKKVDIMLVVGGKNSANTTQLAKLCRSLSVPTYHIETAAELIPEWMNGAKSVGITAGASTPDWIIEDIIKKVNEIGG
ncbi:MAG: 4-hydroxy-3-methylbut-2-enyl diphosphate reductase [Thermodesulfovibrionales bacterium]|nr:4-hydroxy-3-methylbut-2-enyl diphosphate reductase [Nitrospirota bacterium]MDP3259232.1 4-hydroxy-3-methylbut-2-enyl diphosphate reductase [Thermodesulfovibrionales bacterium]